MVPVFLYPHSHVAERLQYVIKGLPAETAFTDCLWSGSGDAEIWRQPDKPVAIFVAADRRALRQLLSLKEFLRRIRVILVLPDEEEETIALAHRLKPRYLCYLEDNCSELGQVVSKMLGYTR
ncbi:MAG: hypothetical protein QME75_11515 [Deltaproteobacteria bacterium]|nr:hypothetical protein [Deltaproteobacteria bacterium]